MIPFTWSSFLTAALLVSEAAAVPKIDARARQLARRELISGLNPRAAYQAPGGSCDADATINVKAPKTNVWADLTREETTSVIAWLFDQKDLNLTAAATAGPWDNQIILVELLQPNKTDVLAYMDGNGKPPTRWSHVTLSHQSTKTPYYQDILVGPLPIKKGTTKWQPLEFPYTRKTQGKVRNLVADEVLTYTDWIYKRTAEIEDITMDWWGAAALGRENDTLAIGGIDPLWQENGRIMRFDAYFSLPQSIFDSSSMMPMGLYFISDVTGRDPSKWSFKGWYHNGIFYKTTKEFRDAYWSGKVEKTKGNYDGPWSQTDRRGPIAANDQKSPPVTFTPQGARYSVDNQNKYVEWMDWSFYVGFNYDTGMNLLNIKHKGQRILYELGLQEALAHYAGSDPLQSHTAYLDSVYGFAPFAFELVKGFDCPAHATYMNSSFYVTETTHTHVDSICMFEVDADVPMSRHTAPNYVAVTKNVKFVIRSVYTIGNYDYMLSYTFLRDGSLSIDVQASGYIQAAFYAKNEDYGFHIHDSLSGSLHDHVINYKADFDILGTKNSVEMVKNVPVSTTYPWSQGQVINTMKLEKTFISNENDAQINWGGDARTQLLIINKDMPNKFGENRGYRILPSTGGGTRLTIEKSTTIKNSANWANHDLSITKRKDTEPRSAHRYNSQDNADPPIDFSKFVNGESLDQTDLVVWFNLGMHHVPHTGDLPNTVFTTAHSGLTFAPSNYLLGDPEVEIVNQVRIDYDIEKGASAVHHFGAYDGQCSYADTPIFPELMDYLGDIVVRKFPYP